MQTSGAHKLHQVTGAEFMVSSLRGALADRGALGENVSPTLLGPGPLAFASHSTKYSGLPTLNCGEHGMPEEGQKGVKL